MTLDLTDAEVEALATVVRFAISELSPEIVAADNWENRALLRDRRNALQAVLGRLAPVTT